MLTAIPNLQKLMLIFAVFFYSACMPCMYPKGTVISFDEDELKWIPDQRIGDSVYFSDGATIKVMTVEESSQFLSECLCAGPCRCCPEDDILSYTYSLQGDPIENTLIHEGFTIYLEKNAGVFTKSFQWNCMYGNFSEYDKKLDSLEVGGRWYSEVYEKEINECHVRKIYFVQDDGFIRIVSDTTTWDRIPKP